MKIYPFKTDYYFYYKCPECCAEHYKHIDEVQQIGKLLCYCGQILELEITTKLEKPQPTSPGIRIKDAPTRSKPAIQEDIIKGLVELGFKKAEAKNAVNRVCETGRAYKSVDEFFKLCLNQMIKDKK